MNQAEIVTLLNRRKPAFLNFFNGEVVDIDCDVGSCTFRFNVPLDYCHSGDIVQGGFITAMHDAAMAHAVFATDLDVVGLASLEISTRYLDVTRGDTNLTVTGSIERTTRSMVFLKSDMRIADGGLTSTAQSVAKLRRRPAQ